MSLVVWTSATDCVKLGKILLVTKMT